MININNKKVEGDKKKEAVTSLNQTAATFRAFKFILFLKVILKKQVNFVEKQVAAGYFIGEKIVGDLFHRSNIFYG